MTSAEYITANAERRAALHSRYDPITGEGSPLARFPLAVHEGLTIHLPEAMREHPYIQDALKAGSVERMAAADGGTWQEAMAYVEKIRLRYDYEFWCATCVRIEHKETAELVPFILKRPQRESMALRERQRLAGRPIRQIELKHRQYGSTTEKNAYVCWLQNVVYGGRHAWMISLVQGGAGEIARRYDTIARHYPEWAGTITLSGVRNSQNTRKIAETGALVSIASVNNPQGPSGYAAHFVLISEAGKMGSTEMQSAERLITNVTSMVPIREGTAVMVESTAEKAGQWFKQEVHRAQNGGSAYDLTFTCWMTDEACVLPLPAGMDVEAWVSGWDAKLTYLWGLGASFEQIYWYQEKRKEYPEAWMMEQENPTTPDEAFQAAGQRVYPP